MLNTVCDVKYSHYSSGESNIFIPAKAHYTANELIPIGKRIDFFDVLDGINWVDSEYYYALNHSAGGKKDSYKLDSIAYEELRKEKLPFYEGQTIKNLAWLNYTQYYEYNVRDVLLLLLLHYKSYQILQILEKKKYLQNLFHYLTSLILMLEWKTIILIVIKTKSIIQDQLVVMK